MSDRYSFARGRVAARIREFRTGVVTLTRQQTPGTPSPSTPWIPAAAVLDVYTLDARVDGVSSDYVGVGTIVATDLMAIVSPKAVHASHAGAPVSGAPVVDLEPQTTDVIRIDGAVKVVKKIERVLAAGEPARFHIFIAS